MCFDHISLSCNNTRPVTFRHCNKRSLVMCTSRVSLKSQCVEQELHHARDRDHKCRKPHGFMNRASSWVVEKSRSRSQSLVGGRGRTWYKGESSHGRVVAHQELLSSVASDSVPNLWPQGDNTVFRWHHNRSDCGLDEDELSPPTRHCVQNRY
jgi:hypothetical protein